MNSLDAGSPKLQCSMTSKGRRLFPLSHPWLFGFILSCLSCEWKMVATFPGISSWEKYIQERKKVDWAEKVFLYQGGKSFSNIPSSSSSKLPFIAHWLELSHMAILSYKRGWQHQRSLGLVCNYEKYLYCLQYCFWQALGSQAFPTIFLFVLETG